MDRNHHVGSLGSRALRYFVAIAELGNLSRAADNLRISQPALSRQIKRLEDQLGVELLVRHWRGCKLTHAGERLYGQAVALQKQLHQVYVDIAEEAKVVRGAVTLAVTPAAGEILVPELVTRYRALYPSIQVTVRQGYSDSVEQLLEAGHADLAVFPTYGPSRSTSAQIVNKPLLVERELLVGPGARRMKRSYRFEELANIPLIVPVRGNGLRALIERLAMERAISLQFAAEVDGMTLIKALVKKQIGYTILPLHSIRPDLQSGALKAAEITSPPIERRFVVAHHAGRPLSRPANLMLPLVVEVTRELVSNGAWPNTTLTSEASIPRRAKNEEESRDPKSSSVAERRQMRCGTHLGHGRRQRS